MLELKTKKELAGFAHRLSSGSQLVRYRSVTYIPADFETRDTSVPPDKDRTIWLPLTREQIRRKAAETFDVLFGTDGELSSFDFMVAQQSSQEDTPATSLLVRTVDGLRELTEDGELVEPTGDFRPNTLMPMLNEDEGDKARVFDVISGWLNSDEEAESLLTHVATCLAPGWSAVKYVLLLGEGRNGKSVFLKMVQHLFGNDNVSHVTRQNIAEQSPSVLDLNGKLLNIVYDGQATYLKDSGAEKSLIAGEPFSIRRLYESTGTPVQTNALFIEGLNREPKTGDKSTALQKRLVRFAFPNVYPLDNKFERMMLTDKLLGAFLSLLVDRYVLLDDMAQRLQPTAKALELQQEQLFINSIGLQFLKHLVETDPLGVGAIIGAAMPDLVKGFQSWRIKENDLSSWAEPDVMALFQPLLLSERRTGPRVNGTPRKIRVVTAFKDEAAEFLKTLEGDDPDAAVLALVEE